VLINSSATQLLAHGGAISGKYLNQIKIKMYEIYFQFFTGSMKVLLNSSNTSWLTNSILNGVCKIS
jgi:hypothetical protein